VVGGVVAALVMIGDYRRRPGAVKMAG
jgi:hypothetical protein